MPILYKHSYGYTDVASRSRWRAEVGAQGLLGHEADGRRHLLRFRGDATTRKRLDEIVTAEAECCSFLDLTLEERGSELLLSVTAPEEGQAIADELAATFRRSAS